MRKLIVFATILLLNAFVISAHDTWLLPRRTAVMPGTVVWMDLTSGMAFPKLETSIKPDRIDTARCRLNGKTLEIDQRTPKPHSLALGLMLPESGIATFSVDLKPRRLELTPKQVDEYFAEIDAPQWVRNTWMEMKSPKRWREVYVKHSKSFVRVGNAENNQSWSIPVGMSLELVPEKDPTSLRVGDSFPVQVLRDGAPLSDFNVGIVRAGNVDIGFRTTGADGRVSFPLLRAGKWLLRGTQLRKSSKPDTDWESDFTTLTVEVR
jgi:uncharacterized GH25 family protein